MNYFLAAMALVVSLLALFGTYWGTFLLFQWLEGFRIKWVKRVDADKVEYPL